MADTPDFDLQQAHRYFSAHCFNSAWNYIDLGNPRGSEANLAMLHTAIASLWHWSQRADVTAQQLSVGYWQVSRVYCLLSQPHNARTYGLQALKHASDLAPFYKAYAYETLARAEMIVNNRVIMNIHLEKARELLAQVDDPADRELLAKDLETIR